MKEKSEAEKEKAIEKIKTEQLEKKIREGAAELKNLELIATCVHAYTASMQRELGKTDTFLSGPELNGLHENAKRSAKSKV